MELGIIDWPLPSMSRGTDKSVRERERERERAFDNTMVDR